MSIQTLILIIILAPLCGAIISGFFCEKIGHIGVHRITIFGIAIAFCCSIAIAYMFFIQQHENLNINLYNWVSGDDFFPYVFNIGILIDPLSVMMLVIVTFVSLLVHIYSIGYMHDDAGYQRFFSYISLFTFMMLVLVTSNNFLQLFFGWEGVGLVSYLLIGFWYHKDSANQGSLKAFVVNRVGDFGFILGIGVILTYTGSIDYETVFKHAYLLQNETISLIHGHNCSIVTLICLLLFVGAMGKSAQVPLHVWLPESMEGPTPISALIHAATMVTAGVFMIGRISPLVEYSATTLSFIVIIGATSALFTGLLAVVMDDIKRVIAYSTLSQLGYMMVAMGISAYSAGMFHLLTHACFKALLFLAAGSVIMGMHHEQDMRKMGGLWNKMPVTYICYLIGSLALCAIPPFAGFYSKDTIIEATQLSRIPGSTYAYFCVLSGAMITAIYTFRSLFMTFHGKSRLTSETLSHVKESPWTICVPLLVLSVPSIIIGYILLMPMLYNGALNSSLFVLPEHNVLNTLHNEIHSAWQMLTTAPYSIAYWLTIAGVLIAWICYIALPGIPNILAQRFSIIYKILMHKYGFDNFNNRILIAGTKFLGNMFYNIGDRKLIDGFFVNGSGYAVKWIAKIGRLMQSGYLYHYTTIMILGLFVFLCWRIL